MLNERGTHCARFGIVKNVTICTCIFCTRRVMQTVMNTWCQHVKEWVLNWHRPGPCWPMIKVRTGPQPILERQKNILLIKRWKKVDVWNHRAICLSPHSNFWHIWPMCTRTLMPSLSSEKTAVLCVLNFMVAVTTWRKREVVNWATLGWLSVVDMICGK